MTAISPLPWAWWRRFVLCLVLLTGLVGLVPLAHALPPDQTWIAGSYDGDDLDDVVSGAVAIDAATKARRSSTEPLWLTAEWPLPGRPERCFASIAIDDPSGPRADGRRTDSSRSPPPDATAPVH